jgi:hypothetical protein
VNLQAFTRWIPERDPDLYQAPGFDPGVTLDFSFKPFGERFELEALGIRSLKDQGWMARAKASWLLTRHLRFLVGGDVFGGPAPGLFGRYKHSTRAVSELRWIF